MAGVGGVVVGKWRQLYLNNNKKKRKTTIFQLNTAACKALITQGIELMGDCKCKIFR